MNKQFGDWTVGGYTPYPSNENPAPPVPGKGPVEKLFVKNDIVYAKCDGVWYFYDENQGWIKLDILPTELRQ